MGSRPNILHIFVDQQRFDTIAALGNPVIKTPGLDRLVESGVTFSSAYTPSPVCIAARCSMIYGQYPMNTGCYENQSMPTDDRQSLMGALVDAGYRTHGIGKCHFSPDSYALRGFESRERQEEGGAGDLEGEPYLKYLYENGFEHICEPHGIRGEMYYIPQPSQLPASFHPSQWIGDRSLAFIDSQKRRDRPWYLFSSFIHPHPPFAPPNPWHKLYRAPDMPLPKVPDDVEALQTYVNRYQNRYKYRDQGIDNNLLRCMKAYYYACISFVDNQVGRILDCLEETGQLENTLILFTADHGEYLGDYECFGKRGMHDASSRIPLIVSMPGCFEGGEVCETPVSLVDIAPTVLSLAGAEMATHDPDGKDLYEIFTGTKSRSMVFGQLAYEGIGRMYTGCIRPEVCRYDPEKLRAAMSTYMAVSREWKYVYSAPDGQEYLFDRRKDPDETRNRSGVSFYQEDRLKMREALIGFLREGGETAGIEGDGWRQFPDIEIPRDPDAGLLIQDHYTPWAEMDIPGYTDTN